MEERILFQSLIKYIKDTRNWNKGFIFLIISLFGFSCNKLEEVASVNDVPPVSKFEEFKYVFPILSSYDWEIHSEYESGDKKELEIELDGTSGDTTIVVALDKWVDTKDDNLTKCYSISRFIKIFKSENLTHEIHTIGGQEILFHYYYEGEFDVPEERVFVEGYYRYLYSLGVLDSLQTIYYLENMDSLNQVKGDDLSDLPG